MKKNSAFSLIELSIVILIVGIVIAGITQSSRLVRGVRIKSAATLTKGAGVNNIFGLVVWLETTVPGSITSSTNGLNPDNNDRVSSWNDLNLQQKSKVNVTQSTNALRPLYVINGIGDLPSVQFDGSVYLTSLASAGGSVPLDPGSDNFTYVAVWRSTATVVQSIFEQNQDTMINGNGKRASLLITSANTYGFNGEGNDAHSANARILNTPYISVMTVGQVTGANDPNLTVKVYTSSNTAGYTAVITNGAMTENVGVSGFYVGVKGSTTTERMRGMISEIMVFNRVLRSEEIRDITSYLSRKYHLKVS